MKHYRWHPCEDRHTTWQDLGRCIWAHGHVTGDGPYATATCGARVVVLYATVDQARARKRSLDREGCRAKCYRRHYVILIEGALHNGKSSAPVTRLATTPAAPSPEQPICGRPRTNGEPCHRPPGWGADPGEKHCVDHGGSVTARTAEKERLADQALVFARLAERARTTPLTAEEQQQAEAAVRDVLGARGGRRGSSEAALAVLAGWPLRLPALEVSGLEPRSLGLLIAELLRGSAGVVS
jgi:hypothetical protein